MSESDNLIVFIYEVPVAFNSPDANEASPPAVLFTPSALDMLLISLPLQLTHFGSFIEICALLPKYSEMLKPINIIIFS